MCCEIHNGGILAHEEKIEISQIVFSYTSPKAEFYANQYFKSDWMLFIS